MAHPTDRKTNRFRARAVSRDMLAGAAATVLAVSPAAADVVYSGVLNLSSVAGCKLISVSLPDSNALNIGFYGSSGGTTSGKDPGCRPAPNGEQFGAYVTGNGTLAGLVGADGASLQLLAAGNLVGAGGTFADAQVRRKQDFYYELVTAGGKGVSTNVRGEWSYGETAFFGFEFLDNGATHYGWGRFTLGTDYDDSYLVDYAYDDGGAAIRAGAGAGLPLPEPGTLLLTAIAGLALLAGRRRA
jgi:hypothetical protein